MRLTNIAIKLNMGASKVLGGNTPTKLLGGIALSAILAAVVAFPSTPAYGAEPVRPMTKEIRISHEQLADDLGEWGQFPRAATVNVSDYGQLMDDLGEFTRVASSTVIPSHDQLMDDLGEVTRVASSTVIPSHDQLMDDLGEYVRVAMSTAVPSHDQLMDDLGEWGR
ncbi:MAG: hypothetical protein J4N90_11450 [Chloroflexi bacterium]|nr:hypothetical protein [Chloroflexota bacterium]